MSYSILIADDNDSYRRLLADVLEKAGYRTIRARNGAETLACVQNEDIDVILLDIFLGDADGLELMESIQQLNATASIIIITGHGTTQTAIEAAKRRAYGYLTKVVDNKNLLELVERAAAAANQTKRAKNRNSGYSPRQRWQNGRAKPYYARGLSDDWTRSGQR